MPWSATNILAVGFTVMSLLIGGATFWNAWNSNRTLWGLSPDVQRAVSPHSRKILAHMGPFSSLVPESITLVDLDEVTVNILDANSNQNHHLRLKLVLELFESQYKSVIKGKKASLRHTLIETLRRQKFQELNRLDGKLYFKELLVSDLNQFLKQPAIRRVHITSFFLQ